MRRRGAFGRVWVAIREGSAVGAILLHATRADEGPRDGPNRCTFLTLPDFLTCEGKSLTRNLRSRCLTQLTISTVLLC